MALLKRKYIILELIVLICFKINVQATGSEIVYLQTDRTSYIAGEPVFYKMYVLDAATRKRSNLSKVGYIELRAPKSAPALKIRVKVDAGLSDGSIVLPDTMSSGVYQVVAFTNAMKNLGEKQFFHHEIVIANRFDKNMDFIHVKPSLKDDSVRHPGDSSHWIMTDKLAYGTREKVMVHLGKTSDKANVAVSVFEESPIVSTEKSMPEMLNNLSALPPDQSVSTVYLAESRAKILRGRVIDSITKDVVPAATVFLSCPDTVANLQYANTDSNGVFQMLLEDYYNGKELFLTIRDMPKGKDWKIEMEDNFILSDSWKPELISDMGHSKAYMTKSQDIVYINKSYGLDPCVDKKMTSDSKLICPRLYFCPVKPVFPSDFVSLDSFPEISVELLPTVRMRRRDGLFHAHVFNFERGLNGDNEPAIFLDGVYVDDIKKIIDLGSDRIKKIEVVESQRAFGDLIFDGIISITSKSNEILKTVPASNSIRLKNDHINIGKSFVSINPDSIKGKNTPFYRQLLYWNPNLELNEKAGTDFEFYTSDNTANFIIKVEGISEDGTPINASSSIRVNNPVNETEK